MSARIRVAFTMRPEDHQALQALADVDDLTISGYIRKAIATHRYITAAQQRGARLLIEEGGTTREVVFQ